MASLNINDAFLLQDPCLLSVPPQAIQLVVEDVRKPRLTPEQIRNLLTDQTVGAQISMLFPFSKSHRDLRDHT